MAWRPFSQLGNTVQQIAGSLFGGVSQVVGAVGNVASSTVQSVGSSGILDTAAANTIASGLFPTSAFSGVGGALGGGGSSQRPQEKIFDNVVQEDNSYIWEIGLAILSLIALIGGIAWFNRLMPEKSKK